MLLNDQSRVKEYLPITGLADFNKLSAKLIFGADSPAIEENRVTTVQCLSGTGSLRVGAEFLARHYHKHTIYVPQPTWGNHPKVFARAGLSVKTYRYYNPETRGLDFQELLDNLNAAPSRAIVLLHACAHNPTGVDPSVEQWDQIRQLMRSKGLLPFFDSASQAEKRRLKEEMRREKDAARIRAAHVRTNARRIAKESVELIDDEHLELMELAASSRGLPSILALDSEAL